MNGRIVAIMIKIIKADMNNHPVLLWNHFFTVQELLDPFPMAVDKRGILKKAGEIIMPEP